MLYKVVLEVVVVRVMVNIEDFMFFGFDEDNRMTQQLLDIHDPKISCKMPCGVEIRYGNNQL